MKLKTVVLLQSWIAISGSRTNNTAALQPRRFSQQHFTAEAQLHCKMPVRMGVLHFTVSVLLLGANSNGRILTHKDEPPIWGTPSQLLAPMDEGPNNNFPHPSRFIGKLESAPSPESGIPSSPDCSRSGVFAIQGTCRGFYMCRPLSPDSGVYSMSLRSCSPDSIFDDVSAACLPSSQAITRPECNAQASKRNYFFESEGDEGVKVIRSLMDTSFDRSISLRCQKRDLLFSSGSSDEICKNVGYVDSYVNLVKFMIPLKKYYEGQYTYTDMFGHYDTDLGTAQDHAKLWRDGDSIVNSITQTFNLSKEFEPEFSRKNVISERNIKNIKRDKNKYEKLEERQNEIAEVKKLIDEANKILKENPNLPPSVKQVMLAPHQEKLAKLEHKLSEDSVIMRELQELEDFLNFVKNDAGVIKAKASETKEKIETFMNYLKKDKAVFKRHGDVSRAVLKRLEQDSVKESEELDEIKKKIEKLEGQVEEGEKQINFLYAMIEESQKKNNAKHSDIYDYIFSFVPIVNSGVSAAETIVNSGVSAAETIVKRVFSHSIFKRNSDDAQSVQDAKDNAQLISQLNATISDRREQMKDLQKLLVDGSTKADRLRQHRYQLIYIDQDLNTVKSNSDLARVTSIGELFNDITLKLTVMIEEAQKAGDAAARKKAQYFIYEEIKGMECAWMFVYNSITDLDICTRDVEILNLINLRVIAISLS